MSLGLEWPFLQYTCKRKKFLCSPAGQPWCFRNSRVAAQMLLGWLPREGFQSGLLDSPLEEAAPPVVVALSSLSSTLYSKERHG